MARACSGQFFTDFGQSLGKHMGKLLCRLGEVLLVSTVPGCCLPQSGCWVLDDVHSNDLGNTRTNRSNKHGPGNCLRAWNAWMEAPTYFCLGHNFESSKKRCSIHFGCSSCPSYITFTKIDSKSLAFKNKSWLVLETVIPLDLL